MSQEPVPPRPEADLSPYRIAIVASRYNARFTDALVESASQEIAAILPNAACNVYRVPGAFEIPVVVERLCRAEDGDFPHAVIALGVIIRGSTAHADLIAATITEALMRSAQDHVIPIIHEVLLVNDSGQAEERSLGDRINRGTEAARAAADMVRLFQGLEA